jgi:glycosyltransferase involved in cell wall biosynthesis
MESRTTSGTPVISVIIPMRNEAETISRCLGSLLVQTIPLSQYEVLVVDGMSDDKSAKVVHELQAGFPNLLLLTNPRCTMPAGMNIGLRSARAPIVMVAGAHTSYPSRYLENCLKYLDTTGADVVGGPLITAARSREFVPTVIAAILGSRFGVGNADFRTGLKEGWTDTVPYGAYRKEVFDRCGMYNERLVRAQDCELHARFRHKGARIYQTPALLTYYHPVSTFQALWRKAFLDGKWQLFAVAQNPQSFALRRFIPALLLVLLTGLAILTVFVHRTWVLIAILLFAYLLAGLYFGSTQSRKSAFLTRVSLPFCAFPFHVSYGAGTMAGLWRVWREPAPIRSGRRTGSLHNEAATKEQ